MRRNQDSYAPRVRALAAAVSAVMGTVGITETVYAQEGGLEEVVVTGSRIVRRDFTAASPIVTVGAEQFENISTIGVESALNQLPQFQPAGTQFVNADVQASAFNNPGISSVNLRGLGTNRNLVLINGRRAQPANATLVVDVNTIPAAAIQNVEVITGGASAVYGADAIGGVVNFILKDDFEGLDLDLQTGSTFEGDGEETRVSVLMGANLDQDRGNVMFGVEWANRNAVFEEDRDFFREGWNDPGTNGTFWLRHSAYVPLANRPSQAAVDAVFPGAAGPAANPGGAFFINQGGSSLFRQEGAVGYEGEVGPGTPFKIHQYTGNLTEVDRNGYVSSPLERYSAFARSTYDINDNLSAFAQANFASLKVDSILDYSPAVEFWAASVPRDAEHPVPADLAALLDSRPDPDANWTLRRVFDWHGPRRSENTSTVYQIMAGVEGSLREDDWTWEAYVSQGRTTALNELDGFVSVARWRELVDAPFYGQGYTRSNAELGYSISCTSGLPIFDYEMEVSQDCIDATNVRMKNTTDLEQTIAEFNLQGGIVEMRSGELRFAVGASYRENTVLFQPDLLNDQSSVVDFPVGLFSANEAGGSTDVSELYGELLIPLAERFSVELGVRGSDYNTVGSTTTYKALFDWDATDRFRFRGGRQVANRAPNTAELFLGETSTVVLFPGGDPCVSGDVVPAFLLNPWGNVPSNPNRAQVQALCSALINEPGSEFDADPNAFAGPGGFFPLELENRFGNPDLDTEEATTHTLGVVFSGERITASVDIYEVDIQDAISPLSSFAVYQQCFNADGMSNPTYSINDPGGYCSLIARQPGSGLRLQVEAPYMNLGAIQTTGADIQLNWTGDVGANSVYVNALLNYIDSYETQDTASSPVVDSIGTLDDGGQYEWQLFTTAGYNLENLNLGVRWRHLPSAESAAFAQNPNTATLGVDSYNMFDFFGGWNISDTLGLRFGIDNLLDEDPEIVNESPGGNNARSTTLPNYYDTLGRRMYVGLRISF